MELITRKEIGTYLLLGKLGSSNSIKNNHNPFVG